MIELPVTVNVHLEFMLHLRDILKEAAEDLDALVLASYGGEEPSNPYEIRRFRRDMEIVEKLDAAVDRINKQHLCIF